MVVCFSGGKDSQVTLDLVQRAGVPFRAVYNVTTIDHPKNVNFIRTNYPEVEFVHPDLNFFDLCRKKKSLPTMIERWCCRYLKEYQRGAVKVMGVRREESAKRASYPVIHSDGRGRRFYPIIEWKEWEVWDYIERYRLPVNPCYDLGHRVGCMVCPFAPARVIVARFNEFPALKKKMLSLIADIRSKGYARDYTEYSDERILGWWISNKSMAEYLQPEFDF